MKREAVGRASSVIPSSLGYDYTTPEAFVDFCERVRGTNGPDEGIARRVQLLEWQLLFDHCHRLAVGG